MNLLFTDVLASDSMFSIYDNQTNCFHLSFFSNFSLLLRGNHSPRKNTHNFQRIEHVKLMSPINRQYQNKYLL